MQGLFIPASIWEPCELRDFPTKGPDHVLLSSLYVTIGCDLVEPIYPTGDTDKSPVFADDNACGESGNRRWFMYGDEEGRFVDQPIVNIRATILFRYPKDVPIVGNVVLFCDSWQGASRPVPDNVLELCIKHRS